LNENHKRSLLSGFRRVDDLLSDIERIMTTSVNPTSPFRKYIADMTPEQQKIVASKIAHIRAVMCHILQGKGVSIDHLGIMAVSNAIHFADMAVEEMGPKHMRGYGVLTEGAVKELNEVASQMQKLLEQMLKSI
jgi:hypothetical protein